MTEFKVGDEVKLSSGFYLTELQNKIGTIVSIRGEMFSGKYFVIKLNDLDVEHTMNEFYLTLVKKKDKKPFKKEEMIL